MRVEFSKMSGAGNDFIVLGPSYSALSPQAPDLARRLCPRRTSVGADGLILVEQSDDILMRYFNSDGTVAEFCGNGARCIVVFCLAKGIAEGRVVFGSASGLHFGEATDGGARVSMAPAGLEKKLSLAVENATYDIHLVRAGVPHAIAICRRVDGLDVDSIGRAIRSHPAFGEEGANVDFVADMGSGEFAIRTFERGIERETLACGSGCVAAAHLLRDKGLAGDVVSLRVASGDVLKVTLPQSTGEDTFLSGPARIVFEGSLDLDIEEVGTEE
jgi:diaminopimelate epimerase